MEESKGTRCENTIINERQLIDFEANLKLEEKSTNTIGKYIRDVRAFASFCGNEPATKEKVILYKNRLREKGYAVRSINSMLASLNSFFTFCGWYDCRVRLLKIQKKVYCPEEGELSKSEYVRLYRAAAEQGNERLKLLIETFGATGIRVSELPFITVEAAQCGEASVSLKGKTRTVFLVRALRENLLQYAAQHGIVSGTIFVTKNGAPLNRADIWRTLKNLAIKAGVDPRKVYPHNFRHLFARAFYEIDHDIAKLADVLGHSSIDTTRIYIISSGKEHREQMERMGMVREEIEEKNAT